MDSIGSKIQFWEKISKKLYASQDVYALVPGVLEDLCRFLDFGYGFLYLADHKGLFTLKGSYSVFEDCRLPQTLDMDNLLAGAGIEELTASKFTYYKAGTDNPFGEKIADIFGARLMIMLPLMDNDNALQALLGIADRRGEQRLAEENVSFSYSVLCTLAGSIKQQIYQDRIQQTQKALEGIVDNMGVDIYVNDYNTHEILYVNRSMAEPYGGVEQLLGKKCWQVLYDDKLEPCEYCPQKRLVDENGIPTNMYSWDYQRPFDGSWFRVLSTAFRWVDGRMAHVVSSVDITENKRNEEIIRRMASYDDLTGLRNRSKFTADCDELIHGDGGSGFSLVFFDLDRFKAINDRYGHDAGDGLLMELANRLMASEAIGQRCYRYGGDEFIIVCMEGGAGPDDILKALEDVFARGFSVAGAEVKMSASIGVSTFPQDGDSTRELLIKADEAMYRAKNKKGPFSRSYIE